jgi:hypothetical protein
MTAIVWRDKQTVVAPSGIAGAQGPPGPAGSGSTIGIKDHGALISSIVQRLNIAGAGVTVTGTGADITITIAGGFNVATPEQYGAVGDGIANDGPAFLAAIAALKAAAANDDTGTYKGSGELRCSAKHYYLGTSTLDLTHTFRIRGETTGAEGGKGTRLRWAANTTGIRVQRYNTSGSSTLDGVTHYGGDGCIIEGLELVGGWVYGSTAEGEYHGIHLKARASIRNCFIRNWQGDGIHHVALIGGGGAVEGNANCTYIQDSAVEYCRNGYFADGDNTNACYTLGLNCSYNRQWGIWDSSFLLNHHMAFHLDSNSATPGELTNTYAQLSGHIYYCLPGQETWCSTHSPSGTTADNQGWIYIRDGIAGILSSQAWVSGMTWRAGGSILTDNVNAGHLVFGYIEGGYAPPTFEYPTLTLGIGGKHIGTTNDYGGTLGANGTVDGLITPGNLQAGGARGIKATKGGVEIGGGAGGSAGASGAYEFVDPTNGFSVWPKPGGATNDYTLYDGPGNQVARIPHGTRDWDLASATAKLKVAGTQVVTARQTGTAADATDLATALTLVNDLKAKLIAHGLIS